MFPFQTEQDQAVNQVVDTFMKTWQSATLTDYAHCVLAIVIVAWFATRRAK